MKTKLAILGVSGVGKDYLVDIMKDEYNFSRFSFSDQLKKLGAKIYPWLKVDYRPEEKELPLDIIIKNTGEEITDSPRKIWLKLNQLRDVEDGLFVRMLSEQIERTNVDNYVISDVRTQNEYDWCKNNGFTFVMVKAENPKHPENSFDDFVRGVEENGGYDYEFTNNFSGKQEMRTFIESCFTVSHSTKT